MKIYFFFVKEKYLFILLKILEKEVRSSVLNLQFNASVAVFLNVFKVSLHFKYHKFTFYFKLFKLF